MFRHAFFRSAIRQRDTVFVSLSFHLYSVQGKCALFSRILCLTLFFIRGCVDASFGCQQNGERTAGRHQYLQSGVGLPGHRGIVYHNHGANIRFKLDHLLLRVLAV